MYFQGLTWTGLRRVLFRIVKMVRGWIPLFKPETGLQVEEVAKQLEIRASLPPQLQWKVPEETSSLSESEPSSAQHSVSTNVASVLSDASIVGHRAVPARPGGTAGRAGSTRYRAAAGRRASWAVPVACSCLASGPRHGPWAVWPCRAARWHGPFSPGRAGP